MSPRRLLNYTPIEIKTKGLRSKDYGINKIFPAKETDDYWFIPMPKITLLSRQRLT